MKRNLAVAPLALALGLAGCDDLLTETPQDFLTTDSYYSTPEQMETAVLSSYQPITRGDVWEWWLVIVTELASDHVRVHPDEPNYGTYHPGLLLWDPTTSSSNAPWNGLFTSIYRANLAISRMDGVDFTDEARKSELIAEARFIRGYSYLLLTKLYGDVPLLVSEADHENYEVARTAVEQVHAQVEEDLLAGEAGLPDEPRQHGRASKAAARMALADLYQWRSSAMGTNQWQAMAENAMKVIDDPNWGLEEDYISIFLPESKQNREMIWMVASSGIEGRTSTNVGCHWLPRELGFGSAGGCEVLGQPTEWFYNSYPEGDYRHSVNYRTSGQSTNSSLGDNGFVEFSWPNVYKYRPTNLGVGGPTDVDFPLYRYAEALLMYAEAQYEMGNVEEATRYVNMVRARARQGTGGENRSSPADLVTVTRDDIYAERGWELAHEGKRWFDQVRRDGLEPGYWAESLTDHDPETAERGDVSAFRKLLPVPRGEIERNSALEQNPGY